MITRLRATLCLDGLTRDDIDLRESQVVDEEPFQFIEIESDGRGVLALFTHDPATFRVFGQALLSAADQLETAMTAAVSQ